MEDAVLLPPGMEWPGLGEVFLTGVLWTIFTGIDRSGC